MAGAVWMLKRIERRSRQEHGSNGFSCTTS